MNTAEAMMAATISRMMAAARVTNAKIERESEMDSETETTVYTYTPSDPEVAEVTGAYQIYRTREGWLFQPNGWQGDVFSSPYPSKAAAERAVEDWAAQETAEAAAKDVERESARAAAETWDAERGL